MYNFSLLNSVGEDVYISKNVEIRRPHLVKVGKHVAIDSGFYCTTSAEIGDYVHIGPYCICIGGEKGLLKMNHFSGMSSGCKVVCGTDDYLGSGLTNPMIPDKYRAKLTFAPVVFEKFTTAGTGVIILPGVTLAEGSVIGANSLVTKSTEPWMVYVGSPAKPVKERNKDKILAYAKEMGY